MSASQATSNAARPLSKQFVDLRTFVSADADLMRLWSGALETVNEAMLASAHVRSLFLMHMTSELRSPVCGIVNLLELALDEPLSKEVRLDLATVHQCALAHLAQLDEILQYVALESNGLDVSIEPTSVSRAASRAVANVQNQATDKGLRLTCDLAQVDEVEVLADPERLNQVLLIVLHNAVKFTSRGEIHVSTIDPFGPRGPLEIVVRDTGVGIPPERVEAIFEPFSPSLLSSRQCDGLGLGLAVARTLMRKMGGNIWASSTVASGAEFHLMLETTRREAA